MSTFVNSPLKIELIGTGEQVGTWGDTTNNNFKALQEAITGSATVDFSGGNVTLTLSDSNALTNARNLRLVCTGATVNSDLILGSGLDIEKLYLVQNDTSYTITVKRSGGDAGVAIVAGGKRFVFNNGTSVVEATNINLASGVSGTLPVVNGGTGQTSYTNGQLLIGNTTGSTLTKATLTGTTNRLTVTNGAGSITLNVDAATANTANKVVARDASGDFSAGTITADLSGDVSGNAGTATTLENARTIGGVSFDGSANIDLPGVNTSGNQNTSGTAAGLSATLDIDRGGTGQTFYTNGQLLIGNTTSLGLTKATLTGTANRLTVTNGTGSITLNVDATSANTANKVVARNAAGDFSAGIITASLNGTANVAGKLSTDSGSAPSFSARAWVNYSGTLNFIRESGNVSTVGDNGTGDFTVNFTTAMQDNDYSVSGTSSRDSSAVGASLGIESMIINSVRVLSIGQGTSSNAQQDKINVCVTIHR